MKLNDKLLAQMRAATSVLLEQGPAAATAAIRKILHGGAEASATPSAKVQPMRDINLPPNLPRDLPRDVPPHAQAERAADAPAPQAPTMADAAEAMSRIVPDMLAQFNRAGEAGRSAFKMPDFDVPAFDLAGALGNPMANPLAGAPEPAPALPGKFIDGSYSNAAGTRSYKLYVPSSYTSNRTGQQAVPLLVMLHGCGQDPADFASGTQMNQLAEEMHCLVVYPAQSQQANAQRCWNWFSAVDQTRGQGEPSIIAGITRKIMTSYEIDATQVYVAGLSAGGAMATIMGTLYPELYAAVGVHSGLPFASAQDLPSALAAMKGDFRRGPDPDRAIPIIVFHGDRDTTVHPANGDELIARGAHPSVKEVVVEPGRVPDGHAYTRTVHQRADGTPHAEQWLIHGAGHAWSGGSAHGSYTDGKGPDASREMMRFFRTKRGLVS